MLLAAQLRYYIHPLELMIFDILVLHWTKQRLALQQMP